MQSVVVPVKAYAACMHALLLVWR